MAVPPTGVCGIVWGGLWLSVSFVLSSVIEVKPRAVALNWSIAIVPVPFAQLPDPMRVDAASTRPCVLLKSLTMSKMSNVLPRLDRKGPSVMLVHLRMELRKYSLNCQPNRFVTSLTVMLMFKVSPM